jgi:hypothetical protein
MAISSTCRESSWRSILPPVWRTRFDGIRPIRTIERRWSRYLSRIEVRRPRFSSPRLSSPRRTPRATRRRLDRRFRAAGAGAQLGTGLTKAVARSLRIQCKDAVALVRAGSAWHRESLVQGGPSGHGRYARIAGHRAFPPTSSGREAGRGRVRIPPADCGGSRRRQQFGYRWRLSSRARSLPRPACHESAIDTGRDRFRADTPRTSPRPLRRARRARPGSELDRACFGNRESLARTWMHSNSHR